MFSKKAEKSTEEKFREKLATLSASTPDLKDLFALLNEMSEHQESIRQEVNGNTTHKLFKKSFAFENMMKRIDQAIEEHINNIKSVEQKDHIDENMQRNKKIASTIILIAKLRQIIDSSLDNNRDDLNTHKNNHKETAKTVVGAASSIAPYVVGYNFGYFTYAFVASNIVSRYIPGNLSYWMGLDEVRSGTVKLFDKCSEMLKTSQNNLEYVLTGGKESENSSPLECPITKCKIVHPVLCMLDYQLYEKEEIVKWLNEKGASPFNRKKLENGQTVASVLVECLSIKNAIEELENKFKLAEAIQQPAISEAIEYKSPSIH